MAYSPKYIALSDVPVQIPDNYNQEDKRDAIESAETMLELDLNRGQEFAASEVTNAHEEAVKQRATYELAKAADDPDEVTLGDMDDYGTSKGQYAIDLFRNEYDRIVQRIMAAYEDDDGSRTYVYNTEKSEDRKDLDEYFEETDQDIDDVGDRVW